MKNSLTRVLLRVVTRGFYQEHTGWLSTLFLGLFINFFWTRVPDPTHITHDQYVRNGLGLVLLAVSEPLGVAALLGLGLAYSLKSGHYVAGRLRGPDARFLVYSSTALPWGRQVAAWAVVQSVILLPLAALYLYAIVVGLLFHYWLVPLLLPGYLVLLAVGGAAYYAQLLNATTVRPDRVASLGWARRWPKPVFSWFLYEVIAKKRLTYLLTKLVSAAGIALLLLAFPEARADARLAGLVALCCAFGHSVLAFQAHEFELFYLPFARSLPDGLGRVASQQVQLFGALLLPELLWLLVASPLRAGLPAAGLLLGVALLLRALLYRTGPRMTPYLRLAASLFLFLLLANLFGLTGWLALGSALAAVALLFRYR